MPRTTGGPSAVLPLRSAEFKAAVGLPSSGAGSAEDTLLKGFIVCHTMDP